LLKKFAGATLKDKALIKKSFNYQHYYCYLQKTGMSQLVKKTTGATLMVVALIKKQV
jgi:hypothetical protein